MATLDATPQVAPQVTPQVARLLAVLATDLDRAAIQKALGLADRKSFSQRCLQPALAAGLIELTRPNKPNSRFQQYRLTARGRRRRDASP